jgi:1-acyl-sn-glycerol-3-phosphate acyltransferase
LKDLFSKKKIDEWALDYWLLQRYAIFCYNIYYRKVEVINRHNIPRDYPVILAPNHQNALMDALAIVCNMPYQCVFLARADIFKGKRLIRLLTFMNIMPVYRIRDGIEKVKMNDAVFGKTVDVLHNKLNPLCLFAEGNHGDKRRLRPLVKGLFRIAFQAQEKYGNNPVVKIVPIGYDYGHYQNFRSTLFVNVGVPIEVAEYMETYRHDPVHAINQLKERFAAELSKQMIDIQTEEYYDLYMSLREVFNKDMRKINGIRKNSLAARFKADKAMIDKLNAELETNPGIIRQLDDAMREYQGGLKMARIRDWVVGSGNPSLLLLVLSGLIRLVLLPLFVFGFINNYLPYWLTAGRTRNLKDPQFHSSFKYVVGMIAFPVWYLVIAGILAFTPLSFWMSLLYIILLPATGLVAFHYFIGIKKFTARVRYYLKRKTREIKDLTMQRSKIMTMMYAIVNPQKSNHANQG